ncbi:MAG: Calx-beta domain-containing protein, partial [Planctomycetota bacterium]
MCKKLLCLISLILTLGLCNSSAGVELLVDVGTCYDDPTQPGWIGVNCGTKSNLGGSLIDVRIETGLVHACECRSESGMTHPLKWVHKTFIKQDGPDPHYPTSDIILTLMDLTPGAEYTMYSYHHNWEQITNSIDIITVTGATDVTKPSSILQSPDFIPGEFIFTAGSNDVVIRYSCQFVGQPFLNGFELYGGGATIQFESASSGELETVTTAQIPVTINGPNAVETYTVDYDVIGGTADGGGDDYTLASGTLTFLPGSSTEYIIIDVNDDDIDEDDETVVIELSSPVGPAVGLGFPSQHTYTIIDPRPKVFFERPSGSGM